MIEIFINYRRNHSFRQARSLFNALCTLYNPSSIYFDQHTNKVGDKWQSNIEKAIATTRVMIVLISPNWLNEILIRDKNQIKDMVRFEIVKALSYKEIQIFPLLLGSDNLMPEEIQLPDDLKGVCKFHSAKTIIPSKNWNSKIKIFLTEFHEKFQLIIQSKLLDNSELLALLQISKFKHNLGADRALISQYLYREQKLEIEKIEEIYKRLYVYGFIVFSEKQIIKITEIGRKYLTRHHISN